METFEVIGATVAATLGLYFLGREFFASKPKQAPKQQQTLPWTVVTTNPDLNPMKNPVSGPTPHVPGGSTTQWAECWNARKESGYRSANFFYNCHFIPPEDISKRNCVRDRRFWWQWYHHCRGPISWIMQVVGPNLYFWSAPLQPAKHARTRPNRPFTRTGVMEKYSEISPKFINRRQDLFS